MTKIPTFYWNSAQDRQRMARLLGQGIVMAGTSDTVLGLLAPVSKEGYQALNQIKHRGDKPYLLLIDSVERLGDYVQMPLPVWVNKVMQKFWPGPLTVILKAKVEVPAWAKGHDGTIAVRIPKHDGLLDLIRTTGPLFSTSANLSGHPVPAVINAIDPHILCNIGALIDDGEAVPKKVVPSTIIDGTGLEPKVVREGGISLVELVQACL